MASSAPRCAHCGKQRKALKRCSVCKHASYCGSECQNAGWKKHKQTCAPPLSRDDIQEKVTAASAGRHWQGVLEWEGRVEELMEGRSDASCTRILAAFAEAHTKIAEGDKEHALSAIRLMERVVLLLGKMERFRDQGDTICGLADRFLILGRGGEAAKQYERARAVGAAHGFFSVECRACEGLGLLAVKEGKIEEGADLLRNALLCMPLLEAEDSFRELQVLSGLILALFSTNAVDELEPLVLRYREAAQAFSQKAGQMRWPECDSLL